MEVPLTKLKVISRKAAPPQPTVQIKVSRPVGVPSSIMVRGMTIDEAMPMVEQYLDQAYCAGYDVVTVIHGRGQGILRREVQELCKRLPYVAEHNLGGPRRRRLRRHGREVPTLTARRADFHNSVFLQ